MSKLKVVMLCHFSNPLIREHLKCGCGFFERLIRSILRKPIKEYDFAQWNTNAIKEFEKFTNNIELHVISPGYKMRNKESIFVENGIHYYFFKDEESFYTRILNKFLKLSSKSYKKNRTYISKKIDELQPDIVHLIGAENPNYSLAALDIPHNIPTLIQLQTLMIHPEFKDNYPISIDEYNYRSDIERKILNKADYIGSVSVKFVPYLKDNIKLKHPVISTNLALTEPVNINSDKKEFDFVYYALNINKSVDYAIEAFAIVYKEKPTTTLDIVGGYSDDYKQQLDNRIHELGIQRNVFFEGKLATHDDVIRQIKKSRFAVLPLKIDSISGTVRESMANGLPVITTITPATPKLNVKRESVLLSPIGDHQAMAENMLKLLSDENYAEMIRENAGVTASERMNNEQVISKWIDAYYACIANFRNGTPIPKNLLA